MQTMKQTNYQTITAAARKLAEIAEWFALTAAAEKLAEGSANNPLEQAEANAAAQVYSQSATTLQRISHNLDRYLDARRSAEQAPAIEKQAKR